MSRMKAEMFQTAYDFSNPVQVLYKTSGAVTEYRQIAVVEMPLQFQVRIFGGTVVQFEPQLMAEGVAEEAATDNEVIKALL